MNENDRDRPPAQSAEPEPSGAPLASMPPRYDDARRRQERDVRIGAAVLSALSVFALVFVLIICQFQASAGPPSISVVGPLACAAIVAALIGGIGWFQWRRHRSGAFFAGILIGVGVAALVEGVCFAILAR